MAKAEETAAPTTTHACLTPAAPSTSASICLLKTAVAPISAGSCKTTANILIDEGPQRSFISADMASQLGITPDDIEQIAVATFGSQTMSHQKLGVATIMVETEAGDWIPITVLIVPSIAAPIQNSVCGSIEDMPHLQGLKLAHPANGGSNFPVSLLIGADYYWTFVQDNIVRGNGPVAQQSKLGYLLSGPLAHQHPEPISTVLLELTVSLDSPDEPNIERFWALESIGTQVSPPASDFLRQYQVSSLSRREDGAYVAKFPWREDRPPLPSNFAVCRQ